MRCLTLFALFALAATTGCGGLSANASRAGGGADLPPIANVERLELRRLWSGAEPNFYSSSPSPDGKLVTEIDWDTGDLAVRDIETGKMRRVTDKGPWGKSVDFAEYSVFSPDGQRIAYSWFNEKVNGYEVRTIRPDGSDMRVLLPHSRERSYACVEDWARDGSSILLTIFLPNRSTQIAALSASDGSLRILKSSDWRHPIGAAFSPDGRFVAFDYPKSDPGSAREIRVVSARGGEAPVVTGPGSAFLLGWLPDGGGILYHNTTNQSRAIWAMRIVDGRPSGTAQMVRPDVWQVQSLGFTRDAFVYGVSVEGRRVRVGSIDVAGGRALGEAAPVSDPTYARAYDPAWSPDGKQLAYLVQPGGPGRQLEITNGAGEVQRRIPLGMTFNPRNVSWTADNTGILIFGADPQGREGLHRIDLRQASLQPVMLQDQLASGTAFYALSPDGGTLYYRKAIELIAVKDAHSIFARDLRTGREREFLRVGPGRGIAVSPDGKWLAFTHEDMAKRDYRVMIAPVAGGSPRSVYTPAGRILDNRWGLNWAPDSASLVAYDEPADRPAGIWQIPVDGRPPRLVMDMRNLSGSDSQTITGAMRPRDLRLSRDGRRIAFEMGRERGEIWMMSGFAPR
jgi:Tol biopolymer transport system component